MWYEASRVHAYALVSTGVPCMRNTESGVMEMEVGAICMWPRNSLQGLHASRVSLANHLQATTTPLSFPFLQHHSLNIHPQHPQHPDMRAPRVEKVSCLVSWPLLSAYSVTEGCQKGGEDKKLMRRSRVGRTRKPAWLLVHQDEKRSGGDVCAGIHASPFSSSFFVHFLYFNL